MKVYSPSQTEMYLFCPLKRSWQYQHKLQPRDLYKPGLARILGKVVAEVAAVANSARRNHQRASLSLLTAIGENALARELHTHHERGHIVCDPDGFSHLQAHLQTATQLVAAYAPDGDILDVELTLPEAGYARIDLGLRSPTGALGVIDYKVKLAQDPRYKARELDKYARSWQLFHYVWGYGEFKQEPVEWYGVVLVILSPKPVIELHPFWVNPQALGQWVSFARSVWARMEEEEQTKRHPHGQTLCRDTYGPCPYTRLCWEFFGDVAAGIASGEYIQEKEKPRSDDHCLTCVGAEE